MIVPLPRTLEPAAAFAPVVGEPPLIRVLSSLADATARERLVVASAPTLADRARECLDAAGLAAVAVTVARDPGTRQQVLAAGLEVIAGQSDSHQPVLVCDCRHPLASGDLAARVAGALDGGPEVVVPTLPVTDTVKTVDATGSVLSTVDRTTLRSVQYPRGFTVSSLRDLVSTATAVASMADDIDEFDAALRAGLDVVSVEGDAGALRFELPRDLLLLEAIIADAAD